MFQKKAFRSHNERVQRVSTPSSINGIVSARGVPLSTGRKLLRQIKQNHTSKNMAKLLEDSRIKTNQLDSELRAAQQDTVLMKKSAIDAVHLAANTAATKTSVHFREREQILSKAHEEEKNIRTVTFLASIARKQRQHDEVSKMSSEIELLRVQLKREKERMRQLEASHSKQMLEQLRGHHLSLGRAIASGTRLVGLAAGEPSILLRDKKSITLSSLSDSLPPHRSTVFVHNKPEVTEDGEGVLPKLLYSLQQSRGDAAINIGRCWRGWLGRNARKKLARKNRFRLLRDWAAVSIQRLWRGRLGRFVSTRVRWRCQYKQVWQSAYRIQQAWVGYDLKRIKWRATDAATMRKKRMRAEKFGFVTCTTFVVSNAAAAATVPEAEAEAEAEADKLD